MGRGGKTGRLAASLFFMRFVFLFLRQQRTGLTLDLDDSDSLKRILLPK